MPTLHQAVQDAFKQRGWAFQEVPGMTVIETHFEAYHSKIFLHLQSYNEPNILSVVANVSLTVPHTHKSRSAELLMRVNRELNLGNFEMDWDGGMVMFRQSQIFLPGQYDHGIITSLVHNALAEVDRLTPYLGTLCQTSPAMLPMVSISELLQREDLLPPPPVSEEEDEDDESSLPFRSL